MTEKGVPAFTITKSGKRRAKTRADLEREAAAICPDDGPKVNFTAAIRELKQR